MVSSSEGWSQCTKLSASPSLSRAVVCRITSKAQGIFPLCRAADLQWRHGFVQDLVAVVSDSSKDGGSARQGSGLTPWWGTPLNCCSSSCSHVHLSKQTTGIAMHTASFVHAAAVHESVARMQGWGRLSGTVFGC